MRISTTTEFECLNNDGALDKAAHGIGLAVVGGCSRGCRAALVQPDLEDGRGCSTA